jgi:hypothetical protein
MTTQVVCVSSLKCMRRVIMLQLFQLTLILLFYYFIIIYYLSIDCPDRRTCNTIIMQYPLV